MIKPIVIAAALSAACSTPAFAADSDIAQIREEIKRMKESYEKRIEALEKRLQEAETKAGKAETTATSAESSAAKAESAAQAASARPAAENAFNPGISLILSGTYGNLSQDPANYRITGIVPPGNGSPGIRGLSLRESEIAMSANIDPFFRGTMLLSVDAQNNVSVEEAYFNTLTLGSGFTVKGGRFFSALGYQNEVHPHAWDFVDASLVQRAFLGDNHGDDGLQVKWVAPSDLLIELGAEVGRGKDLNRPAKNGIGSSTLFAHLGGDIGTGGAYRLGVSTLRSAPQNQTINDILASGAPVVNSFSGNTRIDGADFIVKYSPNGNSTNTNFKLQGEYFRRSQDGTLTFDTTRITSLATQNLPGSYSANQYGWYLQGVYQFMPQWRLGLRRDAMSAGGVNLAPALAPNVPTFDYRPTRNSLMLDWSPSEFSRLRLQLAQDYSRFGVTDNQLFLQYIYSLGPHGAHRF